MASSTLDPATAVTPARPRTLRAGLGRWWPTLLAVAMSVASWGIDTFTAGQVLPLLPLLYVVAAVIRRRGASWLILVVSLLGYLALGRQGAVDPTVVMAAVAAAVTLTGLIRRAGRGELLLQAGGMVLFTGRGARSVGHPGRRPVRARGRLARRRAGADAPNGRARGRPGDARPGRAAGGGRAGSRALPSCPVVILTGHGRPQVLRRALASGARGFLAKGAPGTALADVIRRVHEGHRYVDPILAADALTAPPSPLTPREAEVLVTAGADRPIREVARALYLSPGTVRNHLAAVTQKLEARNRGDAHRIARDNGWI